MPEIGTSGLMSGEGKRIAQTTPRLSSTLPWRNSEAHVFDGGDGAEPACQLDEFDGHMIGMVLVSIPR